MAWLALGASAGIIVASWFVGRRAAIKDDSAAVIPHPLHGWLELAWPTFFLTLMAMLTLKEVMPFAAVLLLSIVLTGVVWGIDVLLFKRRRGTAAEPALVEMARSFFPIVLVIFLLRSFLYEPFKIPSESMLPTLHVGDFILVNKYAYGVRLPVINKKVIENGQPQRGDVMVFRLPENPAKDLIKRVVGLPGDRIVYRNKQLTINDQPVDTQKLGAGTEVDNRQEMRGIVAMREKLGNKAHVTLQNPLMPSVNPAGLRAFPNREQCQYSNEGFACTVPAGHYFTMGDNRDNSDDSRYWGFVPDKNIVGKAVSIWMNFGELNRVGSAIE